MQAEDRHYQRAATIIKRIEFLTLATVTEHGEPWITPVHVAYDNKLRFYWYSDKGSRHSDNIRSTSKVFAVMFDSTTHEGFGVFMRAEARELTDREVVMHARTVSQRRKGRQVQADDYEKFSGAALRRFYEVAPYEFSMNDLADDGQGNTVKDVRLPLDIAKLQDMLAASAK